MNEELSWYIFFVQSDLLSQNYKNNHLGIQDKELNIYVIIQSRHLLNK